MKNTTLILLLSILATAAAAFDGHRVTQGPLTVAIEPMAAINQYGQAREVNVRLTNAAGEDLSVTVRMEGLLDEMTAEGPARRAVDVPAGGEATCSFTVACGREACSALYPVHVVADFTAGGSDYTAHAVQIVETDFGRAAQAEASREFSAVDVPGRGALNLLDVKDARVVWRYFDGPEQAMPVGWTGSDAASGTHVGIQEVLRGDRRAALLIHPPWRPRGGTAFVEYRLRLPKTGPLTLHFANAIRDHGEREPASDGVTFRVWVEDDKLYEQHTDAKVWREGQADLSGYAGREVRLRLESHPGPRRDTTCDASYWAVPMITAGTPAVLNSPERWAEQRKQAKEAVGGGTAAKAETLVFGLEDGYRAAVVLGANGLADASVAIGKGEKVVVFDGFDVSVLNHSVGKAISAVRVEGFKVTRNEDGAVEIDHELTVNGRPASLTATLWADRGGLKASFDCSERITDLALGRADQIAPRVYFGHGYCVEDPEPFQMGFGGHTLSTSHVGFDFESGISLVTACDNPPDRLEVNPEARIYALHTHMNAALTLVPSEDGAFDAAVRYRPLYDKQAAPGFRRKAGRFVFDIWGGRYAENARILRRLIDYGLTDSLLTLHVWQRWGYDYRLPDIYPPNPELGSLEDLQGLSALCREHDIPWGLHDNYIDFYPDATDFSYDAIAFTETGHPIKAWLMEAREAQSYRWRPDCILPFVQRNLRQIIPNLQPTHYFIDVFTSISCFDYYDRGGGFHSSLETRRCWGEAFAWIRDAMGGQAPMTSEAGHDQLTGYIEGADCQFLLLTDAPREHTIRLACGDWERVAWYDAVLHDKFSLHGVGYSGRYQGGRDRETHGIESDDYLSAELLTGHALMIDREGFGRGAVRKYYLAQDFIRSIAEDMIRDVRFADGDMHRQHIRWNGGAEVYVNRSGGDWKVGGKVLPPYGYTAKNGEIYSSIEKIGGVVVEQSAAGGRFYVNARGYGDEGQLEITPRARRIEPAGPGQFKLLMDWDVKRAGPKDAKVFVHFVADDSDRLDRIAFQGDFTPETAIDSWAGHVITGKDQVIAIPGGVPAGEYDVLVGIWSPSQGRRFRLRGDNDGTDRYRVGTLRIQRSGDAVSDLELIVHEFAAPSPGWGNTDRVPINFGAARTSGAFRCEMAGNALKVIPLPDLPAFEIRLKLERLGDAAALHCVTAEGERKREVPFTRDGQWVTFQTHPDDFAYEFQL